MADEQKTTEVFSPDDETRKELERVYQEFAADRDIKTQGQDILNGMTLQNIWDDSDRDYNIFFPEVEDDGWRKNYRSLVTQDKINSYLSDIYTQEIIPNIYAINKQREFDRIFSRVCRGLLDHARKNDGRPTSSGRQKFLLKGHQTLKYGTCHVQHDMINNKYESTIVPNEEIYIPNYFQFDIQKQPHLFRVQDGVTYGELEEIFGELDNFKYVQPGPTQSWNPGITPYIRNYNSGIVQKDRCQAIWYWRPVPKRELSKGREREKYFNVWINGIPMFPMKTKSPFRHGLYPISKSVADLFDAKYYWGKPIALRFKADKEAYDDFRSIILNKKKLNLLPPLASMNGLHVDQDIIVPGMVTLMTDDIDNLKKIPGIGDEISGSDFALLQGFKDAMNSSAPESTVPSEDRNQAARTAQMQEQAVARRQSVLGLFAAFMVEGDAYIILKNCLQFYPREKIEKLVIPDQQLSGGKRGSFELIFQKPKRMTDSELLQASSDILIEEERARKTGETKEKLYIDPSYLEEIDLFIEIDSNPLENTSKSQREAKALNKYQIYKADPLINQRENTRELVREMGDSEEVFVQEQALPQATGQVPMTEGMKSAKSMMNPLSQLGQLK